MTEKTPTNLRIDRELLEGLQRVRAAIGTPVSEQIRRAIRLWLEDHGELAPSVAPKTARKRAATRKRA